MSCACVCVLALLILLVYLHNLEILITYNFIYSGGKLYLLSTLLNVL